MQKIKKDLDQFLFHKFKIVDKYFIYIPSYGFATEISKNSFDEIDDSNIENFIKNNHIRENKRIFKNINCNDLDCGLFLNVANSCNLCCAYCFASQGTYNKARGLMSFDTAKNAIDFVFNKFNENKTITIVFFGGEPLLGFDLIQKCTAYIENNYRCRKRILRIVTNGTLLDKQKVDFISSHNIELVISIDGGKDVQDLNRPFADKKISSFDVIASNLNYVLKKNDYVVARSTYSKFDYPLAKIYKDLLKMGFDEVDVVPNILDKDENKKIKLLIDNMDKLLMFILGYCEKNQDFPFGVYLSRIFNVLKGDMEHRIDCGFGKNLFCVDYTGNIYPCHRFTSIEKFVLGNVNDKKIDKIEMPIKPDKRLCENCWNKFACQHNCSFNNYQIDVSLKANNPTYCIYSKRLTESAIYLIGSLDEKILSTYLK